MGKRQKGSFLASDDKAENHINEGEGKKILRARKMKGRSRREQPRPRAFHPIFRRQNPWAKVGEEKKNKGCTISFHIGYLFSNVFKNPARSGTLKRIVYGGSYEQQISQISFFVLTRITICI